MAVGPSVKDEARLLVESLADDATWDDLIRLIARRGEPNPVGSGTSAPRRPLGLGRGRGQILPGFFDPLPDELLDAFFVEPTSMDSDLLHDRGRGPELIGTRITAYNLLPDLLDAEKTEAAIARFYDLTPEQVAAARAYILNHWDEVWPEHLRIEARFAAGNPPEVDARARTIEETRELFRHWLAFRGERGVSDEDRDHGADPAAAFPSFREWLARQHASPATRM